MSRDTDGRPQSMFKPKPLEQQAKHSEQMLRDVECMLRLRWSGSDWDECFARLRADNEKRGTACASCGIIPERLISRKCDRCHKRGL